MLRLFAHAAAPSIAGVSGDRVRLRGWAVGEEAGDLACELALELDIFARASFAFALAPSRPRIVIGQALRLGPLGCGPVDEHALALVALARSAEAHEYC